VMITYEFTFIVMILLFFFHIWWSYWIARYPIVKKLLWVTLYAVLILLSVSRIYVGAHFPHQCCLGLLAGEIISFITARIVFRFIF
jgi:membrane-associated phospholipid phosphatase